MSTSIDNKIVEMRFENGQFNKNIETSAEALKQFDKTLGSIGKNNAVADIATAANKVDLSPLAEGAEIVKEKFSALDIIAVTALMNITNRAIATGEQVIKSLSIDQITAGFQEYELKMGSVQTIMAGTGESLATVNGYLEELNHYADKTIYSFSDMTSNIGKFTNAGVDLDMAVKAIQGISNEAAVSGANAQQASHAMYNFAQALSAGYVKLIDWKSIENANMATMEFKQQLIDTAVEVGTLTKAEDGLYDVTEVMSNQAASSLNAMSNFNDSLANQWMTTEVLTKTLAKYADETTEIGRKASAAATEVKTFSQLMDTAKEAVGSGWAQTFELIIGDFNEARELFTGLSQRFDALSSSAADARNGLLKEALGSAQVTVSDWDNIIGAINKTNNSLVESSKSAGDTLKDLMAKTSKMSEQQISDLKGMMIEQAKLSAVPIDELIEEYGSFEATLSEGWLTAGMVKNALNGVLDITEKMTEEERKAKGYTDENITQLRALANAASDATTPIGQLIESMNPLTGRELLVKALNNSLDAFTNIAIAAKNAWAEVFPPLTGSGLYAAIQGFTQFTDKIKEFTTTYNSSIQKTFQGFLSIIELVRWTFANIVRVLKPFTSIFGALGGNIITVTGDFGQFVTNVVKAIENSTFLNKVFDKLVETTTWVSSKISNLVVFLRELYTVLKEDVVIPAFEYLSDVFSTLEPHIDSVKNAISDMWETLKEYLGFNLSGMFDVDAEEIKANIKSAFSAAGEVIDNFVKTTKEKLSGVFKPLKKSADEDAGPTLTIFERFANAVEAVHNWFAKLGAKIKEVTSPAIEAFKKEFEKLDMSDIIGTGVIAAVAVGAKKLIDSLRKASSNFEKLSKEASKAFNQLTSTLKTMQHEVKSAIILKIAIAVGILAASMYVVSQIDTDKMAASLGAISALFIEVVAAFKMVSKVDMQAISWKAIAAIVAIAVAMAILGSAVNKMADMTDYKQILAAGGALTALTVALEICVKSLGKLASDKKFDEKKMLALGVTLIAMGIAIRTLAKALKIVGSMDTKQLIQGGIALAAMMAALTVSVRAMSSMTDEMAKIAPVLTAMATAILLLVLPVKLLGKMDQNALMQGMTSLALLLIGLTASVGILGKYTEKIGKCASVLLALGIALQMLVIPVEILGRMDPEKLATGLAAVGGLLLGLAATLGVLTAIAKAFDAANMIAVSGALIMMAIALQMLIVPILTFSAMEFGKVAQGIGAVCLAILALGGTMAILSLVAVPMAAVAATFAVLGIAALACGTGLLNLVTALTILSAMGTTALALISSVMTAIVLGITAAIPPLVTAIIDGLQLMLQELIDTVPVVFALVEQIVLELCDFWMDTSPVIIDTVFATINYLMESLVEYAPTLGYQLAEIVIFLITGMCDAIADNMQMMIDSGVNLLLSFLNGISTALDEHTDEVLEAFNNLCVSIMTTIIKAFTNFPKLLKHVGHTIMSSGLVQGIKDKAADVKEKFTTAMTNAKKAVEAFKDKLKTVGKNIITGLINGIKEKAKDIKDSMEDAIGDAVDAVKDFLGIHSPSRLFKQIGIYCDEGMIQGIDAYSGKVADSAENVGKSVLSSMSDIIADIADELDSDMDASPVIRPTLDLSDIHSKASMLTSIFDSNNAAVKLSGEIEANKISAVNNQNGVNGGSGASYNFVQNNYSPKALSRIDIYRQTESQFARMKGLVNS